jgi:bifunctional UDP-N-acetylglucosamine pyrophosphorylase / glucosamine-1-phosphate N-acetyltransferase
LTVNSLIVIPTAGKGSRTGLNYPKTLFEIDNKPILHHILERFENINADVVIIVSPKSHKLIKNSIKGFQRNIELIVQDQANGMGNAVLQIKKGKNFNKIEDVILVWGDIPYIQKKTLDATLKFHVNNKSDFTFPSKVVKKAYTVILRNSNGDVQSVIETRENSSKPARGERDMGLFIFKKNTVIPMLEESLNGRISKATKEHGFLYIISHLASRNFSVNALPIATELDLISFNSLKDIEHIKSHNNMMDKK